ncbi:hypothetical protein GCM10010103_64930 [Streptomyces paradoxus]|uniref:Uncharacterized protein n=1 Tax=Streptomyces paradoxus TaxID=66375 RepID=A0A7W9WJI2_9ACTN|nr:hypothetical protein [Streptomyces paradoxus]MBB6081097.1 hypothetical protein [Streptomyces paradoxus]
MTEDVAAVRLRLVQMVAKAEADDAFRRRLAEDPGSVFAEYQIPENAVEDYSRAITQARADGECSDFTCFSSECGPTCYVTVFTL